MAEGVQCRKELTPSRSLGYLEVECALNWPAGCPHLNPPLPLSFMPAKEESASDRPICSLLYPLLTSSACQVLADLGKLVTASSFLKQLVLTPEMGPWSRATASWLSCASSTDCFPLPLAASYCLQGQNQAPPVPAVSLGLC